MSFIPFSVTYLGLVVCLTLIVWGSYSLCQEHVGNEITTWVCKSGCLSTCACIDQLFKDVLFSICWTHISRNMPILSLGGTHRGECHSIPPVCPTPSPSMYNDLTPESAVECSQASHISLRQVCIHSVSTEHYVRPVNEAIVTTLASFQDLCMFGSFHACK